MSIKFFILNALILAGALFHNVQAQSPTAAAKRFNIFVKGDAVLRSNETEGPIAIGGNLTSNQYQISFEKRYGVFFVNDASIALAVRGGVKLNDGSLTINGNNYVKIGNCAPGSDNANNLKVWYKDNNGAASTIRITDKTKQYWETPNITINTQATYFNPNVSDEVNPVCENVFGTGDNKIDIDGAFTEMISRSAQLAALTDNLAIRDQNGNINDKAPIGPYLDVQQIGQNPKIIVDPSKMNVLTVSADVWAAIKNSNIERVPSGPSLGQQTYDGEFGLVVNIVGLSGKENATVTFPSFGGLSDPQGSYVIYNFPDASQKLTLAGNTPIHGTIFAPRADVIKENSGNINGQIIANSFVHKNDEVHFWPFLPAMPVEKAITVTADTKCDNNAAYLDYTIQANYAMTGKTAQIEWINSDGKTILIDNKQPLTGKIVFPGTTLDADGKGINWPGYVYSQGMYIEVEDSYSTIRNAGAKVKITVDPSQTIEITYPASTVGCLTSPAPKGPLPVKLASFTAKKENCSVQLDWSVAEATNFSHFEVQRSVDAKTFTQLTVIKFDESMMAYHFTDAPFSTELHPAKNYYYRLKQVDNDESIEYSTIRNVEAGTCDTRLNVDFYPNPTQDFVNVKSFSPVKTMEIFNSSGKLVARTIPQRNETELKVNVQDLAQGLYIVNIVNEEGKFASKILKK